MLDQPSPCSMTSAVEHIVVAFFAMVQVCLTAFLVQRRVQADRERRATKCDGCKEAQVAIAYKRETGVWPDSTSHP